MRWVVLLILGGLLCGVVWARTQAQNENIVRLGGDTTVTNSTANAFGQPAPNLVRREERLFFVGNSFFNQNWVQAPASTTARDGLGPFFNSRSCAGCHFKDGRGRPFLSADENTTGFLIRLSIAGQDVHGEPLPDPIYGGQFQDLALDALADEGDIVITYSDKIVTFADGRTVILQAPRYELVNLNYGDLSDNILFSPRVANQMIGLGLLEAIPQEMLLSWADPDDQNQDGISGRVNEVWDYVNHTSAIGRFGWKANQPHLLQQVAGAFNGDMGITTSVFANTNCSPLQMVCAGMANGGQPEIDDDDLLKVVLYASTLAVPAQRNGDDPRVQRGFEIFQELACNACHIVTVQTGEHPTIGALSNQTIHPFTDLLLHDMGNELGDNRPDFLAMGNEWRTPPLWGIGLFETVNGHTRYLHDGRARNLLEAVLWHDGEAQASRDAVLQRSETDTEALIAFLKSL
jgi:CxxC motif-containing protein (DUF1111 family)